MEEEAINYLFDYAVSQGYKKSREDFVKLIQTNDEAFGYAFDYAKKGGYKKDEKDFGILIGRGTTTPVATTEPAKTEQTTIEPAKTAPAKTEVAIVTPVAETKPTVTVKSVEATPTKEEPMTAEKKEAVKSDIESQLLPVTEKTEVKAIETPSDKMVIKSEAKVEPKVEVKPTEVAKVEVKEMKAEEPKMKVKGKLKTEPIKIETIKVESEKGPTTVEVPSFAIPEPRKKYKPYGEKGPDVYYSEEYDQYIIKEGDNRTVVNKGSGKYEELTNKISESVGSTKEGKGKCDTPPFIGCSQEQTALTNFKYYKGDNYSMGSGRIDEGGLIETLDYRKKRLEKYGESVWSLYGEGDDPDRKTEGDIYYANQEPPKSDRFITYKPFGNDKTLIYDKESGIILKQLDQKAPMVDLSVTGQVVDKKGNVVKKGSDPREYWQKYARENPNEGLTVWQGYELDHPEYKELKSIIEGINYKKEKGSKNTYVAPPTETQFVPDWLKK